MVKGFWKKLEKPFYCLAPMAGVTDTTFRQVIKEINLSSPDVLYTEFVSVDGLCSEGKEKLMIDLDFEDRERPIIAQFFGSDPEKFRVCSKLAVDLGFDGIDINMGCPDKAVVRQGAGSALIMTPDLAKEIIIATKEGAKDLPVSVKTRIGFNKEEVRDWLPVLLEADLSAVAIHGRTKKQGYAGQANWESIKEIVEMAKEIEEEKRPLIIGNGSIEDLNQAKERIDFSGVDGVMVGQGILKNPWLFSRRSSEDISKEERIKALLLHFNLFEKKFQKGEKKFYEMKKYFKAYLSGFLGAKELRVELMGANDFKEARNILSKI